jgi:CBS domain-containing protein
VSEPIDRLRDAVAWPVLPVTPVLPLRTVRDLEPFNPAESSPQPAGAKTEEQRDSVEISEGARHSGASSLMRTNVITIGPERTILELEALLLKHQISGVPVCDASSGELLGVVSQVDIARHLGKPQATFGESPGYYQSLWPQTITCLPGESDALVSDIMTPFVHFATEDASLLELLDVLLDNHIHRVVITRDRMLVGVVTSMDLLEHMRQDLRR